MLKDRLLQLYNDIAIERSKAMDNNIFRASSAGKCVRALAYQYHGFPSEPMQARGVRVLRHGDIIEQAIDADCDLFTEKYGIQLLTDRQLEGEYILPGTEQKVTCHIDGILKHEGEEIIVNIKTSADGGFAMAERGMFEYSHACQAHCEMKAINAKHGKNITKALYYYYRKETSHDAEIVCQFDDVIMKEIEDRFRAVLSSTKDNLPERELDRHGGVKEEQGFPCSYCSYNQVCFPTRTVMIIKGKPYLCEKDYVPAEVKPRKKKGE